MVPKLHAKGSSFKGAAAYVLHDKGRASTSERVAWAETRNLATGDPDLGWRLMAATALDQARLKAEAGVKNTGRKSDKHVLHLTLSWHPDETPGDEEMLRAAAGAIEALGAGDRQALIVAHNDEPQPHVHVLINRVSPIDGRHLPSSKEKLKLSAWAEAWERESGVILCEERVLNNALRAQGQYVRGAKDIARHVFEAQQAAAANDNDRGRAVVREQAAKDHALALKGRNMAAMHAKARADLDVAHTARKAALAKRMAREAEQARAAAVERLRPALRTLLRDQDAERQTFAELERSFFGRAGNAARVLAEASKRLGDGPRQALSRSFRILTDAGARKEALLKAQESRRSALERQQASEAMAAAKAAREALRPRHEVLRATWFQERAELQAAQAAELAQLKQAWKARTAERTLAFEALARERPAPRPEKPGRDQDRNATPPPAEDRMRARHQRRIEFLKASREKTDEQDNAKGPDRGRDEGR
ncbi:MAG: relaxase/mobilization nuclease domain-containing protein [Pseudomonadota bacterium]